MSDEPYYCSAQINIPPEFPEILKQFTKSAIVTQPKDVLAWAAGYFRALANNETPPVKQRIELPTVTQKFDSGLTPGNLRILNKQLGPKKTVPIETILEHWQVLHLPKETFDEISRIGNFTGDVYWLNFFAIAISHINENLTESMKLVCEQLTADPEGGAAKIPMQLFVDLYKYLVKIDGEISDNTVETALNHLYYMSEKQDGMIMPRNFMAPECPGLY